MQRPEKINERTRNEQMPAPTRKPTHDDSWVEYRLLILAELERLNECVDRLRDQDAAAMRETRQEIASTCRKVAASLNHRVQVGHDAQNSTLSALVGRVDALEKEGIQGTHSDKRRDRWAFWTAVITIIGTLIASIISLVLSIQQQVSH